MYFRKREGVAVLDGPKLYAALLAVKQASGLTWEKLCEEAGTNRISTQRLRQGRGVEATTYIRLAIWLGMTDVTSFTKTEGEPLCTFREPSDGSAPSPSSSSSSGSWAASS